MSENENDDKAGNEVDHRYIQFFITLFFMLKNNMIWMAEK